jgi:hypothetical protein
MIENVVFEHYDVCSRVGSCCGHNQNRVERFKVAPDVESCDGDVADLRKVGVYFNHELSPHPRIFSCDAEYSSVQFRILQHAADKSSI